MSVQLKGSGTIGGLDEGLVVSGIVTSSTQINVGSNIKLGNAGVVTATSFVGSGANLTGITQTTINNNADNRLITGSGTANTLEAEANITFDGTNLDLGDGKKIRFGNSNDFIIEHDGSHSYINEQGTGSLFVQSNGGGIYFQKFGSVERLANFNTDGNVELFFDASKKIETTNTGAVVTGICTATSFSGSGEGLTRTTQLSHRNIIINGAMKVAQRATTSTSDAIKTVDRFGIGFATGAIQQDQITLTSSDTPYAYGFRKSYRLTNTTASTAVTAARDIRYQIEAQDIANSGWDSTSSSSKITLSFWIKASVSQTYYVFHYVPDSQKNYNWNFTPVANTWTKITQTIPGASGVTINDDNGPGMSIQIVAYYGTNFTASTNPTQNQWFAWSGTNRIPNMTNTWGGTTNATFEVTGMQLELGEQATPFEHRSFAEELLRCQRYCYADRGSNDYHAVAQGSFNGTSTGITMLYTPVCMRTAPTLSYPVGTWIVSGDHGTLNQSNIYPVDNIGGVNAFQIRTAVSGAQSGEGFLLRTSSSGHTWILDAEL